MSRIQRVSRSTIALIAVLALGTACSIDEDESSSFVVRRSTVSVAGGTPVVISGKNVAYLADEATSGAGGTDFNLDGDVTDSIAVAIDMSTGAERTNLDTATPKGVAATALAWIGDHLYLVVNEALDNRDWNGDTDTLDIVLLHWSASPVAPPTFIDRLSAAGTIKMVGVGSNLFYSSARVPTLPTETNLGVLTAIAPTTPVAVASQDANGPVSPVILGKDQGLVFLSLDETVEARDLNTDTDATDTSVLALLNGTLATAAVHSTELALAAPGSPFRARSVGANDWQVGFLVSEADQDATNFNDPALFAGTWQPSQCTADPDTDTTDSVLHFLLFAAWDTDAGANPPVNTGLVGTRRIAIANGYIATITPEQATGDPNGAEGNCDLNGDTDRDDYVVRWVQMVSPVLPLTPAANLHALDDVDGGTYGLAELGTRFAIEMSESQDDLDIDGDAQKTHNLIGWLTPSGSANANTPWSWLHGCVQTSQGSDCSAPPPSYVGATWMAETPDRTRLNVALQEVIEGVNINRHTNPVIPGEDVDILDSVPTFGVFTGNPIRISFPGVAIAVDNDNAGITIGRNTGFYRVSEAEDSRDWNADGLETGFVLFRTSFAQGLSTAMGPLNSLNRPAVEMNPDEASPIGAVFLADEQLQGPLGIDLNGDGDQADLVISYFGF